MSFLRRFDRPEPQIRVKAFKLEGRESEWTVLREEFELPTALLEAQIQVKFHLEQIESLMERYLLDSGQISVATDA